MIVLPSRWCAAYGQVSVFLVEDRGANSPAQFAKALLHRFFCAIVTRSNVLKAYRRLVLSAYIAARGIYRLLNRFHVASLSIIRNLTGLISDGLTAIRGLFAPFPPTTPIQSRRQKME